MIRIEKHQVNEFELNRIGDYYVFPVPSDQEAPPIYVEMIGSDQCLEQYRIRRLNPAICVFAYTMTGEGEIRVHDQLLRAGAGSLLILPKGAEHEYCPVKGSPWSFLWFNVLGDLVPQLLRSYGLNGKYIYPGADAGRLLMQGIVLTEARDATMDIQKKLSLMILEIIYDLGTQDLRLGRPLSPMVQQVKQYMDSHIEDRIALEQLCRISNVTSRQLLRLFKRELGTTPYDYHLQQKIEAAKNMLDHTLLSIKEIALRLGFNDAYHFSSMFKKKTGCSPTRYQKRESGR